MGSSRSWPAWFGLVLAVGLAAAGMATQSTAVGAAMCLMAAMYAATALSARGARRRIELQTEHSLHTALHDPVTELPNRILFHDRVERAIESARRGGEPVTVLLLDLDRFKEINDTLGHHNGDLLLHRVGERLTDSVRSDDVVARLGGDEFAVLLGGIRHERAAREIATYLHRAVSEPIEIADIGIEVEPSIGIVRVEPSVCDADLALQQADIAMYEAKRTHATLAVYSDEIDSYSRDRLELTAELRRAIDAGEIVLHYQPKADLVDGRVQSVEALARWEHPERGLLGPGEFIPAAELTGLMRPLTLHVIDSALARLRVWNDDGLDIGVAVNISTRNLLDPSLPDELARSLARHAIAPERLELEVTETTIMADPARAKAVLSRITSLGVRIAVDDFGTGSTALGWLRELPLTTLKIDRSFVGGMAAGGDDAVIVRSLVQLGRNLSLEVVAEGVEDQATWDELARLGCDLAQGYHLSRPQPPERLGDWLGARISPGAQTEARTASSTSPTSALSAELRL